MYEHRNKLITVTMNANDWAIVHEILTHQMDTTRNHLEAAVLRGDNDGAMRLAKESEHLRSNIRGVIRHYAMEQLGTQAGLDAVEHRVPAGYQPEPDDEPF